MKIYQKVAIALTLSFSLIFFAMHMIVIFFREQTLADLERNEIESSRARIHSAYEYLDKVLGDKISDWAAWDEAYEYVQKQTPTFKKSNLFPLALVNLRVDLLAIGGVDGRLLSGLARNQNGDSIPYPQEIAEYAKQVSLKIGDSEWSDVFVIGDSVYMIRMKKVSKSLAEGVGGIGYVLMANLISEAQLSNLKEITGFEISKSTDEKLDYGSASAENLSSFELIENRDKTQRFYLNFQLPRTHRTIQTVTLDREKWVLLSILPIGILISIAITQILISSPLKRLQKNLEIAMNPDDSTLIPIYGEDEVSEISSNFNLLKERNLSFVKQKEVERSREIHHGRISALGEMAAGIAHEINNPLAILLGKVNLIQRRTKGSTVEKEISDDLQKMSATIGRISKIISGLRSFARNDENSSMQIETATAIVNDVLEFFKEKMKNQGIQLRIKNIGDQPILCRPVQVQQVLVNMLNNSFDEIKDFEDPWIEIELKESDKIYELSVTDSGNGIPPEIVQKLFQPFFTTKPVGEGTGLGLSISRSILKDHGGEFRYDPNCQNTKFVMVLPKPDSKNQQNVA